MSKEELMEGLNEDLAAESGTVVLSQELKTHPVTANVA